MGFPLKLAERRPKAPEAALLALLRGVPLAHGTEKSWPEVSSLAEAHLVAPLLHASGPELPAGAREALGKLRSAAQAEWRWQQAALRRITEALEGTGALIIHGAAHAEDFYPAPELRPIRELHLLIAPSRTFSTLERLSRKGYRIEERPDKGWLTLRLRDPRDARVLVNLRRGFAPPNGSASRAASRSEPEVKSTLPVGSLCLRAEGTRLHPDDAILVHAVTLAEDGLRAPLIDVVDLAHLFRRCDPSVVVSRARKARLLAELGMAFLLLERCVAAARRFGGVDIDLARIPRVHLDVAPEVERAVDHFELSADPGQPGALARALRLVAPRKGVE
ncbi:MAG TPA: nucleotidyltransferase family protein [Myxococcales bacterium]|nr:nucleotidyltransferase family protein [Myxococcales bacterium]